MGEIVCLFYFQVIRAGGLESLMIILKAQVVHKNAITCGVLQAHACQPVKETDR